MKGKDKSEGTRCRYNITLLVDDIRLMEKCGRGVSEEEATKQAVRWALGKVGDLREGRTVKITVVKVVPSKAAVTWAATRARFVKPGEEITETDRLRIPAGTVYQTTHPRKTGERTTTRSYMVTAGCRTNGDDTHVSWRGDAGYLCWAERGGIQKITE